MNYYEHHLGDYLRDTVHLSMLEDAAYRRLLDAYYTREGPLPADPRECCKLARAASRAERDAVQRVLEQFFQLEETGHHQRRADAEIARFQDKQRKARASADARWSSARLQPDGNANADANASPRSMRTHSEGNAPRARTSPQAPVSSHQPSSTATGRGGASRPKASPSRPPPEGVEAEVWSAWLDLRRKKRAPVNEIVLEQACKEAALAKLSLEDFLRVWCFRGTQGLLADWIKPADRRMVAQAGHDRVDMQLRTAALMVNPPEAPGARRPAEPAQEVIDVTARRIG